MNTGSCNTEVICFYADQGNPIVICLLVCNLLLSSSQIHIGHALNPGEMCGISLTHGDMQWSSGSDH